MLSMRSPGRSRTGGTSISVYAPERPDWARRTAARALDNVFLKGYQWPFDSRKAAGSSRVDLAVQREIAPRELDRSALRGELRKNGAYFL